MPGSEATQEEIELLDTLTGELDWRSAFDAGTLKRGFDYAARRMVHALEVPAPGLIDGTVMGSGHEFYHTRVRVRWYKRGPVLSSTCSCPVGAQCKHAVALIEEFITAVRAVVGDPAAPIEQAWLDWLDAVSPPGPPHIDDRWAADRQLALFVRVDARPGRPLLQIAPVWLRPSRGTAQVRMIDPLPIALTDRGLMPAPVAGWDGGLEERLTLLLLGETRIEATGRQLRWVELTQPVQARAFRALLAAEAPPLLFYEMQTGPRLRLAPAYAVEFAWRLEAGGMQRLEADIAHGGAFSDAVKLALVGDDAWYLDPVNGTLGAVDGDGTLLLQVHQAPPLPAEKAGWLAQQMEELVMMPASMPAPEVLRQETVAGVAPCLRVHMEVLPVTLRTWPRARHELGCGMVHFDYGDVSVSASASDRRVIQDGRITAIERDAAAERALLAALPIHLVMLDDMIRRCGLRPAEPSHGLLLQQDYDLPESLEQWPARFAAPEDWWPMIERLRRAGVRFTFADDFPPAPRRLVPDAWHGELEPVGNGWFDLALDIEVDGARLNLLPILRQLLNDGEFSLEPALDEPADATYEIALSAGRVLALPRARLRSLVAPIIDWVQEKPAGEGLRLPVTAATQLEGLAHAQQWQGREDLTALAVGLAELPDLISAPAGLVGELRDYQARGVAWLRRLAVLGTGGILADDMGLGKTIQVLAHILDERARGTLAGPVLVVAPTSLVGNWCDETARFCPGLAVLSLQLPKAARQQVLEVLADADIVVTTYALLVRDLAALQAQHFALVVLDEAQAIKNASSQAAHAVRALNADRRLAMTGTPLENHLGELWAQLDAVAPGLLGSAQWFGKHFRRPIEQHGEVEPRERLAGRIGPLMLRRTRDEVLTELPEKTESVRAVVLNGAQRELYESLRLAQHQRVQQSIAERGLAGSGIVMLDALLKLRQVCCDPRLVKLDSARAVKRSAKLDQLRELLPTLIEQGRRILVFSQFTEMLGLIAEGLTHDGISFETLTGQTPGMQRKARVARFQEGAVPVFLISLKAGGVGLNLTAADTVIHYDPWWNPAVEAQATGRAHRMGQRNPVMVYKLVCSGTVEERITELQHRKADLAASILGQDGAAARGLALDPGELDALFAPMLTATGP